MNQGGFGRVGRKEVRFWMLLKVILTRVTRNSKFVVLSNWRDRVIGMGKFVCVCGGVWELGSESSFRHAKFEKLLRGI